jgi:hypothetical protein
MLAIVFLCYPVLSRISVSRAFEDNANNEHNIVDSILAAVNVALCYIQKPEMVDLGRPKGLFGHLRPLYDVSQ